MNEDLKKLELEAVEAIEAVQTEHNLNEVKALYCEDNGRPSIDPVVLFKLVFIQALDGINSMRQTCKKTKSWI